MNIPPEEAERRLEAYQKHGTILKAAESLGIARSTLRETLRKFGGDQFSAYKAIHTPKEPVTKPRGRMKAITPETALDGPVRRVAAIGDIHDKPGRSKDHLKWISRWVAEERPDNVVVIGDAMSLDSLSQHDPIGSQRYYEKPTFVQDIESGEEAVEALNSEGWSREIGSHITMGNHEYRAWRAENQSPHLKDTLWLPVQQLWARHNWATHDYGEWLFLEGVGFIHVPFNGMGRDYRGKVPENQIGNDAVFSIVFGHTHKEMHRCFPKIGPQQRVDICNLGTALPYGTVEDYASLSATGWTWGVKLLTLQAGHIVGHQFIGMQELEGKYG